MYAVVLAAVVQIFFQGKAAAVKRHVVPWNFVLAEQARLKALFTNAKAAD